MTVKNEWISYCYHTILIAGFSNSRNEHYTLPGDAVKNSTLCQVLHLPPINVYAQSPQDTTVLCSDFLFPCYQQPVWSSVCVHVCARVCKHTM